MAAAIVAAAAERNFTPAELRDFDSARGKGVVGSVEGRQVTLGSKTFLTERGVAISMRAADAERLRRSGATAIFLAVDGKFAGFFGRRRPDQGNAAATLQALRDEGLRIVMLTGDSRTTADAVGESLRSARSRRR